MKIFLVILAAFALMAFKADVPFPSINLNVPAEYKTGSKTVILTITTQENVAKACDYPGDKDVIACAQVGKPFIWMQNPCDYPEAKNHRSYAYTLCHEIAHTKGWSHG